jgi:pyrroline-5-carboxylate reductase
LRKFILGFIGAGNMSQAIIKGATEQNCIDKNNVYVFDIDDIKLNQINKKFGVARAKSAIALCETCDIIVLAVKPNVLGSVIEQIKDVAKNKTLVSIAAGWDSDKIKSVAASGQKVIRLMPNTPLMVGEGMSVFESPSNAKAEVILFIESVFGALGKVAHAPSKLMHAVTAISGSGPAYVFMFIEALSDAGVLCGLTRDMATTLATQTVLGSAKMVQETKVRPGELKDAVCSPGGTTIEAVKSLEKDAFRSTIISAVQKCADKSKKLAK